MALLTIPIDNLKCGGCANTIRRRLVEFPFVNTVTVDPEAGTVSVTHDGSGTRAELVQALGALGYPEIGTGGLVEKAKSYVSCAIGRIHGEQ